MSLPQDQHRPLFPLGNPFKMISSKRGRSSHKLLDVLSAFEQTLAGRMQKLVPKEGNSALSLAWMKAAIGSLCETHSDIKSLISELDLPVNDWDEKWVDIYLDVSVKLLDICVAFSSEISRLNHGNLYLKCVLHHLESSPCQFVHACSSLDGWTQHINSKNPRFENCSAILNSLVQSIDLPKVKNSAKGKVLMRAMYGVKVQTVFVCGVFAAGFTGCPKKLLDLSVAGTYTWAQAFADLQANINREIKCTLSGGKCRVLKELGAVDYSVHTLHPMIQDGIEYGKDEEFKNSVIEFGRNAEKLSQGLDLLSKEVDAFFHIILKGRDALIGDFRDNSPSPMLGKSGGSKLSSVKAEIIVVYK